MKVTTIKIKQGTKTALDKFREYKNESYDEVLSKLIYVIKTIKKNPRLSQKTLKDIEEARKRIAKGEYYTQKEVEKMLC